MDTLMMSAAPLAAMMKERVAREVSDIKSQGDRVPKLVALLIGNDPISRTYVDLKKGDCQEVGIESEVIDLSQSPPERILEVVELLNRDESVSAVIPQMPFSRRISEAEVFGRLSPSKDVDGLTPFSLGKLLRGEYTLDSSLLPCTPKGIVLLVKYYGVPIDGSDVAIIGRSVLVSEPLRKMLQDMNATATCYHTHSKKTGRAIAEADIVVAAAGRPPEIYGTKGFRLTGEMIKSHSTVISVGIRKDPKTNRSLFDVDTGSMKGKASFVSPNTGGVGLMTRAVLLWNTVIAARRQDVFALTETTERSM